MKLKQSDKKGFSARSTGAINTKELPTRSFKSKSHQDAHSETCIRFGEFETLTQTIGCESEDLAIFHALYRTSVKGRKDIVKMALSGNDEGTVRLNLDDYYTSRVAEIFQVILKSLSLGLEFIDDNEVIRPLDKETINSYTVGGRTVFCTEYQYHLLQIIEDTENAILEENPILTKGQLYRMIRDELKANNNILGNIDDELKLLADRYPNLSDDGIINTEEPEEEKPKDPVIKVSKKTKGDK